MHRLANPDPKHKGKERLQKRRPYACLSDELPELVMWIALVSDGQHRVSCASRRITLGGRGLVSGEPVRIRIRVLRVCRAWPGRRRERYGSLNDRWQGPKSFSVVCSAHLYCSGILRREVALAPAIVVVATHAKVRAAID